MTAYKDVENINRIISYTSDDWGIYIHLDKKSKINIVDINPKANIFKIKKIYWGSWEHLWAFNYLLTQAEASGVRYDYYHLITGQDFYASPVKCFDEILGDGKFNYLGIFQIPNTKWGWESGLAIFRYRTLASFGDIRERPIRYINSVFKYIQKYTGIQRQLPAFSLYGGPVYCSLTGDFVKWMINSSFAGRLLEKLRNSTCSEEVYFATVIMNSPFRNTVKVDETLRYVDWHASPPPKYLQLEDFPKIIESRSLFCRKVDSDFSKDLIRALETLQE